MREYQKITGVSKPAATRELAALVNADVLEKYGVTGKGTYYTLKTEMASQRGQTVHDGLAKGSKDNQRGRREW